MAKKTKIAAGILLGLQIILLIGVAGVFLQNEALAEVIKEYVAARGEVHEIYDDTAVVNAYKSGNADGLNEQDKYVLEQAKKVIAEHIKAGMTDYEKEKAIYDWQVAYTTYNNDSLAPISSGDQYSHLPYGVFKYHQAICVGHATTFKLLMDMLDIECEIIHSTEEGEHAWNLVKLDDGWYHCDVTFDGSSSGKPFYSYFNVPDSVKDDGSYPWDHEEIPAADGVKYCYLARNAGNLKDLYAVPDYVREQLDDGIGRIAFTLQDAKDYNRDVAAFIASAFSDGINELYAGDSMLIGNQTIYIFEVMQPDDGIGGGQINPEVQERLQEIMDALQ